MVVVGAGSAGCVVAARLAAAGASVLLIEAGPGDDAPELRDVTSLAAATPGHPRNWSHPARLRTGSAAIVPRGRGLGGSSAINGAAWTYVTPADAEGWGIAGWSYADLLPSYAAAESVIPIRAPEPLHAASRRFLGAATALGFPAEPEKNAGGPPGAGPVPTNSVDGRRIDTASAYLGSGSTTARPTVRTGATVARVVLAGKRAVGVELADSSRVSAAETVLCAGAVGTPRLLLRSGIGPGLEHDLPGVGRGWSDHPAVYLPFRDTDPPAHQHVPSAQVALNADTGGDPAGDVEILLFARPFVPGGDLHLMCALQQPDSRGVLDGDEIAYGYLRTEHDRRRLRHVVRTAAELLRSGVGTRTDPDGDVLGNDRSLDGWIAAHLTTSVHLCGSAALGRVVDAELRVFDLTGLRVADTSVLPLAPRRGPAATAVAIGERGARLMSG